MRPLEALVTATVILVLGMRWVQPRNRQVTATMLAMLGILAALHFIFDGWRWEMVPTYVMAVAVGVILSRDLRRVSGARAGESSRWIAVPSTAQRTMRGLALAAAAVIAVLVPLWIFPRIVLPEPDGLYDVGRLEVTWTDSSRSNRAVTATIWYPAESPNGRALRYHPAPGSLGTGMARETPLAGFMFRNITAARTHSTREPRFSIREGRSPLVIAAHADEAHRYESTALYEQLASYGYVVASVGSDGTGSASPPDIVLRAGDLQFALNRLVSLPDGGVADTLHTHIRTDRVALMGRGAGAAAALELAATEPSVTAVVAVAPDTLGPAALGGVRRPVLIFTVGEDASELDDVLRYGGTEARLEGASAASLSDRALLGKPVVGMLGIESGDDAADIHATVSALTLRFLDQYLKERTEETQVDLPSRVRVQIIPHQPRAG